MAKIEDGVSSSILAGVDTTFKALRTTLRPQENLSWNSIGAQSGSITGIAANGAVFSLRNIGTNNLIIRRVGCGVFIFTAFTTAQVVDFSLIVARSFTASDTGGTAIALTGNNCKHRTSLATVTNIDCRIATTAALTAGTKTLDTNTIGQTGGWSTGTANVIAPTLNNLFQHDPSDYPLVLATNEGINIQVLTAMGAAGVGRFYANIEFAEVTTASF